MKVGIFTITADADHDPAIIARHAEDLGFSSYWVPDHIILPVESSTRYPGNLSEGPDPDYLWKMPDPLIALMRAATATQSIEIGTGILLVPERNPLHLAKEIASLDHFSGGRFQFGIGAGWNKEECQIMGGDFDHRWKQIKEAVQVMKTCWMDHDSEHHGHYYDFPPIRCYPKPVQLPHPPIYLGGIMFNGNWSKHVFNRVATWGNGWFPVVEHVSQIVDGREQLIRICEEKGRDPAEIQIRVFGGSGQWRRRQDIEQLEAAGVGEVTIWLEGHDIDSLQRELDDLASELL